MIKNLNARQIADQIRSGNRAILAQAMTIIESTAPKHAPLAAQILDEIMPYSGTARRIGITGVPGAGKSSLLEVIGIELINQGCKVAIVAIDPSSSISGGSILGDKTRMATLLREENAFIRPVPTSGHLGGTSRRTRELVFMLEAAGFDYVFIETVGVGQSEIEVADLVDFFCLVQIAGAGDELQGIKKGIMELADLIIINKDDGENKIRAQIAKRIYQNSIHILKAKYLEWITQVITCSATEGSGINVLLQKIDEFYAALNKNQQIELLRQKQYLAWTNQQIEEKILNLVNGIPEIMALRKKVLHDLSNKQISPRNAVDLVCNQIYHYLITKEV